MKKLARPAYTAEFKELAVNRVKGGESTGVVAKELGMVEQTLRNWVRSANDGKLKGARPNMRFVPIKNAEQQAVLSVHRARQGFVKVRTAQANQIRGLVAEFGIIIPQGIRHVAKQLPEILENVGNDLPGVFRELLDRLGTHLHELDQQVDALDAHIQAWHRASEASRRLAEIPGIGPITASALVATVGDARNFENGRQLAAWLGLVPRQHSSGGKPTLLSISKRGDSYVRTLLIHGARAVIRVADRKAHHADSWLGKLLGRRNQNIAAVCWRTRMHESSGRYEPPRVSWRPFRLS